MQLAPYISKMASRISALSALSSAQRKHIPLSTEEPSVSSAAFERTRPMAISRFERKEVLAMAHMNWKLKPGYSSWQRLKT